MDADSRLLALALGTFHAVLITLAAVLLLHLTTDLGEALAELETAVGLAIFGVLWATSVYCAHRGITDAGLQPGREAPAANVLRNGATWGAWNGVLFFWCLLAGGLIVLFLTAENGGQAAGVVVFGTVALGVGTIASYAVGFFLGLLFAVLDIELLWAARSLAGVHSPE